MRKRTVLFLGILGNLCVGIYAQATKKKDLPEGIQNKTATQIIQEMDQKIRGNSSIQLLVMKIETPQWKRILEMKVWSQGLKHSFVRILSPQRERGIASLKRGQEMWNYLPKAEMVIKIPSSMMMGSWMGSDFSNDDLVKASNLYRDYTSKILKITQRNNQKQLQIELKPKPSAAVVWGKLIIWVRSVDGLPSSQEYYNEQGKKVREMLFSQFKKMGDRVIPTKMVMKRLSKPNNKTTLEYKEAQFNKPISRKMFTLRNLKKKSW